MRRFCIRWYESARYFVLPLGARFKMRDPVSNTMLYALVVAGFKVQAVVLASTAPEASKYR